jgi:hypothetical protein
MDGVVVSAGEPVAWKATTDRARGGSSFTSRETTADAWRNAGFEVTPCFASAGVVLPEEPPADLIEQMAKAACAQVNRFGWEAYPEYVHQRFRAEARAFYPAFRSWVVAGGETR